MLEDLIEKKKNNINKTAEIQKRKIDFVKSLFDENYRIMAEYVKKENLSPEQAFENLHYIINTLSTPLHLEADSKKNLSINEINESIYVKLGYYKIFDESKINPKEPFEQCSLEVTKKGQEVYKKYKQLENN